MLSFDEEGVKTNGLDAALGSARTLEEERELAETICARNPEAVVPLLMVTLNQKHQLREKLNELNEKLNQSQWRPAVFLRRMASFSDRALVAVGGQRLSVAIAPGFDLDGVETGTPVFLDGGANLLVSIATEILPVGSVGVYSRPHGDRVVLVGPGDEEIVVEIGRDIRDRALSAGDLLVFDRDVMVAIDIVESRHEEASILQTLEIDKSIEELAGLDGVFEDILSDIELHLLHPEIASRHRLKPVKGILLTGPPGVGKTSLIKCLGRKLSELSGIDAKVLLAPPSIHRAKWYGETEERIRSMFAEARRAAESEKTHVLFVFDDIDHLGSRDGVHGIDSRTIPSFLHEIDELRSVERILLIGSTNRPDLLDRALLRPGRFGDRQYPIPRPGSRRAAADIVGRYLQEELPYRDERASMIESVTSALYAPNGELQTLATLHFRSGATRAVTPSMVMSGALIEAAAQGAKRRSSLRAVRGETVGIGTDDLLAAFDHQLTAVVDRLRPETARQLLDLPPDLDVIKVERAPRKAPRRFELTRSS